jgi:hypothetical protein
MESELSSTLHVRRVVASAFCITWPIYVGKLQPALVYMWIGCLWHIIVLALVSRPHCHPKVIDIHLYPLPSLSPVALPSTPSPLVLPQCYSTYNITPSVSLPFYSCSSYVAVIDFKVISFMLYCYYPFNPFIYSSFHPLAYGGCWWDLRRDPFIFLSSHYTCPWCIPGFVWCLDYHRHLHLTLTQWH